MTLEILGHSYAYEMECLARLFYPGRQIEVINQPGGLGRDRLITRMEMAGDEVSLFAAVYVDGQVREQSDCFTAGSPYWEWDAQRRLSALLFDLLCESAGARPPWGMLTGVRPVSFSRKMMSRFGLNEDQLAKTLAQDYRVLPEKAELVISILGAQKEILAKNTPRSYSLYIGIPFCPTRCLYCSFVSHAIDKAAKILPDYLRRLYEELAAIGKLAGQLGLKLCSIYIGGGTPTTLSPGQLRDLLEAIQKSFPTTEVLEYTVEAGRPDTITGEKLEIIKSYGVCRISVNPQTMDDTILKAIGREHTATQARGAVQLARQAGFDNINMDIIAGLPGQTPQSFLDTVEQILCLRPENITVHTLTVKRSSDLRTRHDAFDKGHPLDNLLNTCRSRLSQAGYRPYYLYRQQGSPQNLENIGYCLPGKEGLYNIYSMEDAQTILAAGAGGVTKLCAPSGKVMRIFNYKYPYEYISGFETLLGRKAAVQSFYEKDVRQCNPSSS